MTKWGAYSEAHVYCKTDLERVVQYAKERGVKVVPEFDQPAHVGRFLILTIKKTIQKTTKITENRIHA